MKPLLMLFFLVMFVIGTDTFLLSPLLPTLQHDFGVTKDVAGWMVSAYALGYALFALVSGPFSDGRDRKTIMILGLLGFAVSTALCGMATGFWPMIVFRFLAGVSAAFATPQVWAAIPTLLPQHSVVRGMGIATAGLALAQALGVPFGSLLAASSWSTPFFAIAVAALLVTGLVQWIVPAMPPASETGKWSVMERYKPILRSRPAKLIFSAYFLFQLGNFGRFSFIGMWFSDRFHFGTAAIGSVMIWFGVGNLLGSLLGPRWISRWGTAKMLYSGLCLVTVISLVIPVMSNPTGIEAMWLVTAGTFGVVFPIMMNVLQSISASARGTIASLANAVMYAGTTIGSALAGEMYAQVGGFAAVSTMTAFCFFASLWLYVRSGMLPRVWRTAREATAQA